MHFQPLNAITALSLILLPALTTAKCPIIVTTVQAPLCPPTFTLGPILTLPLATEPARPTGAILTRPKCIKKLCTSYASISNYCPCPRTIEVSTSTLPCSSPGPCPTGCAYTTWKTYLPDCFDTTTTTKSVATTTAVVTTTTSTRTIKTLEPCLICDPTLVPA